MIDWYVEAVAFGVVDVKVLAFNSSGLEANETSENADPIVDVHDVVPRRQRRRQRTGFGMAAAMCATGLLAKPEYLQIGQEKELRFRSDQPLSRSDVRISSVPGASGSGTAEASPPVPAGKDILLFNELREAVDLVGSDGDPPAVCQALPYVVQQIIQATRKPGCVDHCHRFNRQKVDVKPRSKRQDTTGAQLLDGRATRARSGYEVQPVARRWQRRHRAARELGAPIATPPAQPRMVRRR